MRYFANRLTGLLRRDDNETNVSKRSNRYVLLISFVDLVFKTNTLPFFIYYDHLNFHFFSMSLLQVSQVLVLVYFMINNSFVFQQFRDKKKVIHAQSWL